MKKFLAIAMVLALVVVGCKKPEPETKDSIKLNTESWTAPYEGDVLTLTVTASGDFKGEPDVAWITVSGAKVTVAENTAYEPRSGKVTFTCGEASAVLTVNQEAAPKPKEYTELAGPANCYIISAAGDYKFNATVIGNGEAGLHSTFPYTSATINPAGAALVWQEVDGLISDIKFLDGYICFNCANRDGNAVIAATDADGTILWSWHIWSAEAPKDVECGKWILLDRNIGATLVDGEESYGLYYQWGRKDPFSAVLGFDSASGEGWYHPVTGAGDDAGIADIHTIAYSVAHPMEYIGASTRNNDWLIEPDQRYLWGVDWSVDGLLDWPTFKPIFDPCPAGYCVASPTCLSAGWFANGNLDETTMSVYLFNNTIVLPPAGFIYTGGYGWWNRGAFAGLWEDSSSWSNTENAFRFRGLQGAIDGSDNYDRATGHPVRCMKENN